MLNARRVPVGGPPLPRCLSNMPGYLHAYVCSGDSADLFSSSGVPLRAWILDPVWGCLSSNLFREAFSSPRGSI